MNMAISVVCILVSLLSLPAAALMLLRARRALQIADGRFLLAFSGLLAAVAAANGVVEQSEIATVEDYLTKMGLTPAEKALCYGNFILVSREQRDPNAFARKLAARFDRTGCMFLYALVWKVAKADGDVDADEDRILKAIAADFGFGNEIYAWFKADEAPIVRSSDLRKAGVPASLLHLAKKGYVR